MPKDPATLWYWNDWMGGTMTMSRHEKGAYMDLLTAQFNSGHLTETQIRKLLGNDQGLWGTVLREKFVADGNGSFYNQRLEDEMNKRRAYVESRETNGKKGGRPKKPYGKAYDKPYGKPKENLLENVNEDEIEIKEKGGTGEKTENWLWDVEKEKFTQDGKWIFKFCTDKSLTTDQFDHLAREFLSDLELKEDYKPVKEIRSHFTNWYNKKKIPNGTYSKAPGKNKPIVGNVPEGGFGQL